MPLGQPTRERAQGIVILEERSHIFNYEMGMMAAFSGVLARPLAGEDGFLGPEEVKRAVRPPVYTMARTGLVTLENTHNMAGGTIYPQAQAQIAADRAGGRRVVIATASFGFYAEAIGAVLGVADVIGTRVVVDHGCIRARIDGENCYGAAKLRMFENWLATNGITGAEMRFYSDHASDAPMFERAAEAVATNASPALRALAAARGWRLLDWAVPAPAVAP